MHTSYLVAHFVKVGPFYLLVRLHRSSEPRPTIAERYGDHQFTCIFAHASHQTLEGAEALLNAWLERRPDLLQTFRHLEQCETIVRVGVRFLKKAKWVSTWRNPFLTMN